jgi:hypothetical protein
MLEHAGVIRHVSHMIQVDQRQPLFLPAGPIDWSQAGYVRVL